MKLKNYSKEDLELLGYDEIAVLVLEQNGKKMKIADLFKTICNLLELSEDEYVSKIGDFFGLLSTNKNFISLENGFWDLRKKHNSKVIIDEDEDEGLDPIEEMPELKDEEEEEDIFYETDDNDDEEEDDLKDLVIIDEDEDEANIM